jgi:hypothetical protein
MKPILLSAGRKLFQNYLEIKMFEGKISLVTGGNCEIGRVAAIAFGR